MLTWNWFEMQDFVVASVLMILPRRTGLVLAAGVLIGQTVASGLYVTSGRDPAAFQAVFTLYTLTLLAMGGAALVGSGWLARTLADLDKAQREQADLAVTRERVRLSRDLHDLLGQSLATASLKGDLALSMLAADPAAAKAELEGLAVAARSALIDLRAVTQDKHAVTLRAEIASAVALLGAAGIHTAVEVADYALARPVEEAMAWAVREAATNTLRHSQATRWSVTARQAAGRVRLTIINDGAQPDGGGQPGGAQAAGRPDGQPSGLSGVAARARALSGNATIRHTSDGQFRLAVEIPLEPS